MKSAQNISDGEEESSGDGMEVASSVSKNFRNDENILTDPSRVTSWTLNANGASSVAPASSDASSTSSSSVFKAVKMANTQDGFLMPVLSASEKERYLMVGVNAKFGPNSIEFRRVKPSLALMLLTSSSPTV